GWFAKLTINRQQPVLPLEQRLPGGGQEALAGGHGAGEATSSEVVTLRQETEQLKQLVAELSLKNRLLKKV
ncbi:MAG: hypothetical protein HY234_00550, partial [Acidobacteria bacterium]|nr:hypothetical protein [Acidobacteriota bacterium]